MYCSSWHPAYLHNVVWVVVTLKPLHRQCSPFAEAMLQTSFAWGSNGWRSTHGLWNFVLGRVCAAFQDRLHMVAHRHMTSAAWLCICEGLNSNGLNGVCSATLSKLVQSVLIVTCDGQGFLCLCQSVWRGFTWSLCALHTWTRTWGHGIRYFAGDGSRILGCRLEL